MVCDAKLGFDDNAFFRQSKNDHYSWKLILIENLKLSFLFVILVDIPCCPNYPPSLTFPSLTLSLCNFFLQIPYSSSVIAHKRTPERLKQPSTIWTISDLQACVSVECVNLIFSSFASWETSLFVCHHSCMFLISNLLFLFDNFQAT